METFSQVFGFVAAISAGIIILTIFFTGLSYVKRLFGGASIVKMKGFLKDGKLVNVHLSNGRIIEKVRFVGFTDQSSAKNLNIPYQLSSLVVLESAKGARILVKADAVRTIEEVEDV